MTLAQLAAKVLDMKNIVAAALIAGGVLVTAWGMLKVPAQQAAIASTLQEHNKTSAEQTNATNRKLDVLICLQAKLDTPIRCVAKEAKPN
jgi:hypothetical protein